MGGWEIITLTKVEIAKVSHGFGVLVWFGFCFFPRIVREKAWGKTV